MDYLIDPKSSQEELINSCLNQFQSIFISQKADERSKVILVSCTCMIVKINCIYI